MDSIAKRPRTRLSPLKRKQQLMEIALEVFARRGIGRGGHADIAEIAQVSVATVLTTSQLAKIWLMKFSIMLSVSSRISFRTIST